MPIRKKSESLETTETKHCPYCDNEIKVKAIKCQYCGEFLDGENHNQGRNKETNGRKANTTTQIKGRNILMILGIIMIILGLITFLSPSSFWMFLDIIAGILFIITGISCIVNIKLIAGKIFGVGFIILGFLQVFSSAEFLGILMIWSFALWALIKGCILAHYSITNRKEHKSRPGILIVGIFLILLSLIIAFSNKEYGRTLAGICIGISTIVDGLILIIYPKMINKNIEKI